MESIHKNAIIKNEQEILNAMKNSDVLKLDQLLHKELLFNIPNGETITKTIDLQNYSSGNMQINEITASEQQINIIENTAVVSVITNLKGHYANHPIDGKYKVLRIWKLYNKQWKVIAGNSTLLKENS
ncbi:nuclear transport factor 2 family protein [Aquimarina agarilytica]|uniref:nuclear transport factor 2 family protein n=1 Tax=Aquimarina agarilytica TaxID=1087449 RepID=UPI0002898C58|nr:nuclear transport factor 2 family protein [Aquimarina agarilytica]